MSLMDGLNCSQTAIQIEGPAGSLEVLLNCAAPASQYIAVICHPHPLHGGSMQNKVVHTLEKSLHQWGAHTLRFNFRGVGNSAGQYDGGAGEVDDLLAIVNWARQQMPQANIILSGFSFGAYIAIKACQLTETERLIAIAPPVNTLGFDEPEQPVCPCLVIQGEQDEIIDADRVYQWAQKFSNVHLVRIADAGHFFHARLNQLQSLLLENLK